MLNDKESPFTLTLTLSGLCLPVVRFHGEEALNQPYRFDIELIGLAPAVAPGTLLQQPVFLRLDDHHGIHGVIHSASCEHRGTHRIGYRLMIGPSLLRLAQPSKRRVFVQQSVPQILQQLLAGNALPAEGYRIEMTVGCYPVRPFCIQFEESDLALLHRLCEEEGIHYHFEHRVDGHVVVFADDSLSLPQEPTLVPFKNSEQGHSPSVSALFQHHHAAPLPILPVVRNRGQQTMGEDAANQTRSTPPPSMRSPEQRHSEQRSRRQLERQRGHLRSVNGRSDCIGLHSGHLLQVSEHPINSFNEQWRITAISHQGQHPSILDTTPTLHRYHNEFTALPWSTDFRPPLRQQRPSIAGYHMANILGVTGQPARLDDLGRVAVKLWPSDPARDGDAEAIWLPIAMTSTNGRLVPDELPRVGSDVWVSFLDSDPDRPILCLGHSRKPTPREPPPTRDRSLLLDWLLDSGAR